jgi:hypothetical protein
MVYTSFWGPTWTQDATRAAYAGRLSLFFQDLLNSNYMNVLTQYGVLVGKGTGAFVRSVFPSNLASSITDAEARGIIQDCINAGALPDPGNPTNNVLITFLDDKTSINDPDPSSGRHITTKPNEVDGYHDHFVTSAGGHFYYAFLSFSSDESLLTQVASHEFAEAVTDPEYNAWTTGSGQNEIGDSCENNDDTITVGSDSWTVQKVYSNADHGCVGQAANPLAENQPGPGMGTRGGPGDAHGSRRRQLRRFGGHERLLPLPDVHFDVRTKKVTVDERHVLSYIDKLFYPLRPEHISQDFGSLLRPFLDVVEKRSQKRRG